MAQLTSVINVNVPKEVKEEANRLFNNLGLNMSTAINMFLKRAIYERGIPFEVIEGNSKFNKHLLDALEEGDAILKGEKDTKSYTNAREMVEDILNDDESTQ